MGFLTTKGSPITNAKHNIALLQVATLPYKAAILHFKGHQKDNTFISTNHNLADSIAIQVDQQMPPRPFLIIYCNYTKKEIEY
jgi:hypothetical protein